jgi:hypothetical protein
MMKKMDSPLDKTSVYLIIMALHFHPILTVAPKPSPVNMPHASYFEGQGTFCLGKGK